MNLCKEFAELISAYADGELAEPDKERVEAHLSTCGNCSALLEFYTGISAAVAVSGSPAPESLRGSVMEKILCEDAVSGKAKRQKIVKVIFTRYVPVAACLAIILLTLPRIIDLSRLSYDSATTNQMAMIPESSAESDIADFIVREYTGSISDSDMSGGGQNTDVGKSENGSINAPAAPPPSYSNGSFGNNSTAPELAPATVPSAAPEPEDESTLRDQALGGDPVIIATEPSEDVSNNYRDFSGAYALIEITGALPELLTSYEPELLYDMPDWKMRFDIPRDTAQALIEEAGALGGISVTYFSEDSDHAVVLYLPGD